MAADNGFQIRATVYKGTFKEVSAFEQDNSTCVMITPGCSTVTYRHQETANWVAITTPYRTISPQHALTAATISDKRWPR